MRIRFRFSKLGKIRFTSQRDVARMWERALRRAALPLAYTEGFSPRPQLSFGLALPTGCESLAEYLDVVLDDHRPETAAIDISSLPAHLTGLLPAGIEVERASLFEKGEGSLQQQVTSCSWEMRFTGVTRTELEQRVGSLLAASVVPIVRERKGREEHDDLRPSVLALAVSDEPGPAPADRTVGLVAELATQPRACAPPSWRGASSQFPDHPPGGPR
jgi:radical SAM-linked protein